MRGPQRPHGLLDDPIVGIGPAAGRIFRVGEPEEENGIDPQSAYRTHIGDEFIDREPELAGHGGDRLADAPPAAHKHRIDELMRVQPRLADQLPDGLRPPQPPQPGGPLRTVRGLQVSSTPMPLPRNRTVGTGDAVPPQIRSTRCRGDAGSSVPAVSPRYRDGPHGSSPPPARSAAAVPGPIAAHRVAAGRGPAISCARRRAKNMLTPLALVKSTQS